MADISIKIGDYVVATKEINDIKERSVGLVGRFREKDFFL